MNVLPDCRDIPSETYRLKHRYHHTVSAVLPIFCEASPVSQYKPDHYRYFSTHAVSLQIIHFPFIDVVVEMNQFIPFGSDAIMPFHHMYRRIFVVRIVDCIAPFIGFSSYQFYETILPACLPEP